MTAADQGAARKPQQSKTFKPTTQRSIRVGRVKEDPISPQDVRTVTEHLTLEEIFDPTDGWRILPSEETPELEGVYKILRDNEDGTVTGVWARPYDWDRAVKGDSSEPWVRIPNTEQLEKFGVVPPSGVDPDTKMNFYEALAIFRYNGDTGLADAHVRFALSGMSKPKGTGESFHAPTTGTIGRKFTSMCGHEIMFARNGEGGTWYRWKNKGWVTASADEIATQVAAPFVGMLVASKDFSAQARSIDTVATYRACVSHARGHEDVSVNAEGLDANPHHLGTPEGTVDLKTGKILPPMPTHRVTRSTRVEPVRGDATEWTEFMSWAMSGDQDRVDWLQEALGMSLVGEVMDEAFFVCIGEGANGKTVMFEVVRELLGTTGSGGYAQNAPQGFLTSGMERHQTEIARLDGARFLTLSETKDGARFNEDKAKNLSSTNQLSGNLMRENIRDFSPTHTMWISTNHMPQVESGGAGFYRRIKVVEFLETVPEREQDKSLARNFVNGEGGEILNWLIEGARRYLARGRLPECAAIEEAGERFRRSQEGHTIEEFVEQYCILGRDEFESVSSLYEAYLEVSETADAKPLGRNKFSAAVAEVQGVNKVRRKSGYVFKGVALDPDALT
ncbi:DNA primase family protein [Demequina sp. SO4-13]|uniref:DNA primase family protein n=1 Tax=Demequina sp. SO4-13 TaxID=3401027 RepID=UPI003AF94FF9